MYSITKVVPADTSAEVRGLCSGQSLELHMDAGRSAGVHPQRAGLVETNAAYPTPQPSHRFNLSRYPYTAVNIGSIARLRPNHHRAGCQKLSGQIACRSASQIHPPHQLHPGDVEACIHPTWRLDSRVSRLKDDG